MVVVALTMHPVNDASLTPNPTPFSLAGGTHSTARTAVVSTFSGDTDLGDAGLKVGFDGGEYKAIIYGRLPEKKDALGETGDANANIVGMKLNFTINNNDTTALHYAISEFDVKFFLYELLDISDILSVKVLQLFFGSGGGINVASITELM